MGGIAGAYFPRSSSSVLRNDCPHPASRPAVNPTKYGTQDRKHTTLEPDCSVNTSVLIDGPFRGWSVDSKELTVPVPPAKLPQAALSPASLKCRHFNVTPLRHPETCATSRAYRRHHPPMLSEGDVIASLSS